MWGLISSIIASAIVIPYALVYYDEPVSPNQMDVLQVMLKTAAGKAALCFFTSWISGNYSQIDKLWSIIPAVYVWEATIYGG